MSEEQNEKTAFDPGDAQQEMKQVAELRESIDSLVQTITEQVAKEEEEKLQAMELQAQQEKELAEQQAKEKKTLDEQQELQMVTTEEENLAVQEFREQVVKSLSDIDTNITLLNDNMVELKEVELQNQEMFNYVIPSAKQASDLQIIFLCLIPLFIVYRWLASMFNSAF